MSGMRLWEIMHPGLWEYLEKIGSSKELDAEKRGLKCRVQGVLRVWGKCFERGEVLFITDHWVYVSREHEDTFYCKSARLALFPISRIVEASYDEVKSLLRIKLRYSYTLEIQVQNIECCKDNKFIQNISKIIQHKALPGKENPAIYYQYFQSQFNKKLLKIKNMQNDLKQTMVYAITNHYNKLFDNTMEQDHKIHDNFLQLRESQDPSKRRFKPFSNFESKEKVNICETYPKEFLLFDYLIQNRAELKEIIDYREKKRIPLLCYIYKRNPSKSQPKAESNFMESIRLPRSTSEEQETFSTLWRSGQVKSGLTNSTCNADVSLVRRIGEFTFDLGNKEKKAQIFDCRPWVNAVGNKIAGKGYLDPTTYNIFPVTFGGIGNIHAVYKSFATVLDSLETNTMASNVIPWLKLLKSIMEGGVTVANHVSEGTSVIVNCSDGWDRTPQVISLAKIILEPYYRTLQGFRILLSYEWNGFGHKFCTRQQFSESDDKSPIFIQFLDLIHQIMLQHPNSFEFNQSLLETLAEAVMQNFFIEFNFDNTQQYFNYFGEHEKPNKLEEGKVSEQEELFIWRFIYCSVDKFLNPTYKYRKDLQKITPPETIESYFASNPYDEVLEVDTHLYKFQLWTEIYNTFKEKYNVSFEEELVMQSRAPSEMASPIKTSQATLKKNLDAEEQSIRPFSVIH